MGVDESTRTKRVSLTFLCLERKIESDMELARIGSSSELSQGKSGTFTWAGQHYQVYVSVSLASDVISPGKASLRELQRLVVVWLRVEEFCSEKHIIVAFRSPAQPQRNRME